ncbi:MAG: hypothetical protein GY804_03775 [Alphaproteobacteria bacterium]|nr:hypothetical protein [Alphaproteobacteria bacterium]
MKTKGLYTSEHTWEVVQQSLEERRDWVKATIDKYTFNNKPKHLIKELEDELIELDFALSMICRTLGMFDN